MNRFRTLAFMPNGTSRELTTDRMGDQDNSFIENSIWVSVLWSSFAYEVAVATYELGFDSKYYLATESLRNIHIDFQIPQEIE